METLLIIILILLVIAQSVAIWVIASKFRKQNDSGSFSLLQNQMNEITRTLDNKLTESTRMMQEQFGQSTKIIHNITGQSSKMITEITEKLTSLDRTNQQVIGFSEQLSNLEKVLKSQKQRGNLGEAGLQLVLENILPPSAFAMQYKFPDGTIVDAAVFTKDGIIPIDAKFSLENYNRIIEEKSEERRVQLEKEFKNDLKKRIDETGKYVNPKNGTLDFAFMFIPAEAIYYDLLVNEVGAVKVNTRSLIEYAFKERHVIIVSPTTFAAYLQTVLQGLRALKIEEDAKAIQKNVELLQRHIRAYDDYMRRLGMQLETTVNTYNHAHKEFVKIDKDVVKIAGGERSVEAHQIHTPKDLSE